MAAPAKTTDEAIVQIAELLEEYRVVFADKTASDTKSKSYISVDPLIVAQVLSDLKKQIQTLTDLL